MRTIYTDGSCLGNPGPGGRGALIHHDGKEILLHDGAQHTTNNIMELTAAVKALTRVREQTIGSSWLFTEQDSQEGLFAAAPFVPQVVTTSVRLVTDSTYVKQGITDRIVTRKKRQWRRAKGGKLVEHVLLWKELDAVVSCFSHLDWERTKAHVGTELNERVDQLARQEATKRRDMLLMDY